jgi:hypothetical protein
MSNPRSNVYATGLFLVFLSLLIASGYMFNVSLDAALFGRKSTYWSILEYLFGPMNAISYNSLLVAIFAASTVLSMIGMVILPLLVSRHMSKSE